MACSIPPLIAWGISKWISDMQASHLQSSASISQKLKAILSNPARFVYQLMGGWQHIWFHTFVLSKVMPSTDKFYMFWNTLG